MPERVSIQVHDGVADVRLNRPDKMNALDAAMFRDLNQAGTDLAGDPSIRAVVLSGEGRAFCAGLDFSSFAGMAGGGGRERETLGRSFAMKSREDLKLSDQSARAVSLLTRRGRPRPHC